ncbi:MAG: conjugal transfer protein TraG N-terminal domain-containing protein [Candidatus Aenigmatarchaeota archaeon]
MDWVITSGVDVENIRFILNAIAAIFNDGALKTLASVIVMLSLFFALVTYQTRPGGALSLVGRWFLILIFFFSLFHVKTTVSVYKSGSSVPSAQVANVPVPVAFFGSFFTSLDYSIARLFDAAFSVPELLSSSKGAGFSSLDLYFRQGQDAILSLVSSGNRYHIDNLNAFFDNCITKTVMQGYINMQTLQTYGWKNVAGLVNPAFYTPIHKSDGSVDYVSCGSSDAIGAFRDAYDYLSSLPSSGSPLHKILFPAMDQGALNSMFVNGSTAAVAWLSGINSASLNQILADTATFNFFMQSLSRNSLNPASFAEGYIKVAGESCMQGVMSQRYLPFVKTIMFYLVFGALPLILLFLLSPMWKITLLSIGTTGLWFAFWSGLTSVFNGIVGLLIRNSFSGYSGLAEPASVLWSVSFVNNYTDMVCMVSGYASYIPVIALTLASGSMYALTSVANSLAGTVKAAGDKVTDPYDFAERKAAMAMDAARGLSKYNAISTALAQADAVNTFAGGMLNMAYSDPFVKSTMVAAENQAYGIGAAMRHMTSAKTDKLDYYDTLTERLRPFELNSPLANSSDGFVNALKSYFSKLGRNLDIYKTTDGYLLYENGVFLGSVENGRINWASTPVQVSGSVGLSSMVSKNATRNREGGESRFRLEDVSLDLNKVWFAGYRREKGRGYRKDIFSFDRFENIQQFHTGRDVGLGLGMPSVGGGSGNKPSGNQLSGNQQSLLNIVTKTLFSVFRVGVDFKAGEATTVNQSGGSGNQISITPKSFSSTTYGGYDKQLAFSLSNRYTQQDNYSDKRSVSDNYSSETSQSDTVSYSLNTPASDLVKHFSKLMGLSPTTANESALLLMAGSLLMASDKSFADKVNESIAKERLGIQETPSNIVSKEIPKIEQKLQEIKEDLVPEEKKEKEEEKKEEPPKEEPKKPPSKKPPSKKLPSKKPPSEKPPQQQPPSKKPPSEKPPQQQPPSKKPPSEKPPHSILSPFLFENYP